MLIISQIQTFAETITAVLVARFFVLVFYACLISFCYYGWCWGQQLLGKVLWLSAVFYLIAHWLLSVHQSNPALVVLMACLYGLVIGLQGAYFWQRWRW